MNQTNRTHGRADELELELVFSVNARSSSSPGPIAGDVLEALGTERRQALALQLLARAIDLAPGLVDQSVGAQLLNLGRVEVGDVVHAKFPPSMSAEQARNVGTILRTLLGDNVTVVVGPADVELDLERR